MLKQQVLVPIKRGTVRMDPIGYSRSRSISASQVAEAQMAPFRPVIARLAGLCLGSMDLTVKAPITSWHGQTLLTS